MVFDSAVSVKPLFSTVSANLNELVRLTCTMEDYIHPDADFKWRKGNQIILDNARHNITFTDGIAGQGQNNGTNFSRYSTLTIFNVSEGNEGSYTCFVMGTQELANVQLNINPPGI